MSTVYTKDHSLHTREDANALALQLNNDPWDDWTYKVVKADGSKDLYSIQIYDQAGEYVGML